MSDHFPTFINNLCAQWFTLEYVECRMFERFVFDNADVHMSNYDCSVKSDTASLIVLFNFGSDTRVHRERVDDGVVVCRVAQIVCPPSFVGIT